VSTPLATYPCDVIPTSRAFTSGTRDPACSIGAHATSFAPPEVRLCSGWRLL